MDVENTTARMYSVVIDEPNEGGTNFRVDFKPGKNTIPEKDWEKVKGHSYTKLLKRSGIIVFEGSAKPEKGKKSKGKKRGGKIEGL